MPPSTKSSPRAKPALHGVALRAQAVGRGAAGAASVGAARDGGPHALHPARGDEPRHAAEDQYRASPDDQPAVALAGRADDRTRPKEPARRADVPGGPP